MNNQIQNPDSHRILLVDDNPANLNLLIAILETQDYSLSAVLDGSQALKVASEIKPDLILMDIVMPNMDGYETTKYFKSNDDTRDIPIIFITEKNEPEDIKKAFESGGVDFISKPINAEEVLVRVESHLKIQMLLKQNKKIIEELQEANLKLDAQAKTDHLTGLFNRRSIVEIIEYEITRALRSKETFCLVLGDIDHFKQLNDSYGHLAGDHILIELSQLMKKVTRDQDVLARWGGEEFLLVLPATDLVGARLLAEKIRARVAEESFDFNGQQLKVTMSFGVESCDGSDDYNDSFKTADENLYKAKSEGRNRVVG